MRPRAKAALAGSGIAVGAAAIAVAIAALSGGRETTRRRPPRWSPARGTPAPDSVPRSCPRGGAWPARHPRSPVPAGGSAEALRADHQTRALVHPRANDFSIAAMAERDPDGVIRTVRYFDAHGALSLVVSRVDILPAFGAARVGAATAAVCHDVRSLSGQRWTGFPIRWRLRLGSIPRRLSRPAVLRVARTARRVWIGNLNHCGVPTPRRATFSYSGNTTRAFGRNGVNTVEFGEVDRLGGACVGAVACTFTWGTGSRATKGDIPRVDTNPRRPTPWSSTVGAARGRRPTGVLVHETGHSLGLNHVQDASNVMYPFVRVGRATGRRLGLGDARANNALY
ncbi:MAG: matrixin family metalloprotease [Thermoleophilia bacterium]